MEDHQGNGICFNAASPIAPGGEMHEEDDESEIFAFSLSLYTDEIRNSLLGNTQSHPKERVAAAPILPSEPIASAEDFPLVLAEAEIRKLYFNIKLHHVEFALHSNTPVCLLTLTFCFHNASTQQRFSRAEVVLEFKALKDTTASPANLATTCSNTHLEDHTPKVLARAPKKERGVTTMAPTSTSLHLSIGEISLSAQRHSVRNVHAKVQSEVHGTAQNRILWTFDENPISNDGIPDEVTCAVVVGTKGKRFCGQVKVSAKVGGQWYKVAEREEREKVVYFVPGISQDLSARRRTKGLVGGRVQFEDKLFIGADQVPLRNLVDLEKEVEELAAVEWA